MKISKQDLEALRTGISKAVGGLRVAGVRKSLDGGTGNDRVDVTKQNICFSKFLRGGLYGDWTDAETEQRVHKALGESYGTAGGFLVPPQISAELIELLKPKAVVRSMPGVRTIPMTSNQLVIGRVQTAPNVTWGSENALIAEDTGMTYGQITLLLKKCVCLYKCSRELLRDASVGIDALIKTELAEWMALAEDLAFIEGTGGTQPLGLYYNPMILSTSLGETSASYDTFSNAIYQVETNLGQLTGWLSHPRLKNSLRQLKDGNGQYLWQDGRTIVGGNVEMPALLGAPVGWSTQMAITNRPSTNDSYVVGGQWSNFLIGEREGIRIETTDVGGDSFVCDQVWIKAVREVDAALRHPQTFVRVNGIQA
jgi:HK97 family phage major capsid protein